MKLLILSSSPLVAIDKEFYAYSPYVKELAIWAKNADETAFLCPVWENDRGLLISKIPFPISKMFIAKEFNLLSIPNFFSALKYSFRNFYIIFQAMAWADHIHLRCPGNIGLMGCILQVFFPGKPKTAKYAGNWDPQSNQPWSYKLQRWILSNTFLTKNIKVLVYGEWKGSSKNIKSFFTASYKEEDKTPVAPRSLKAPIAIAYVGTLVPGKQPLYAVKLAESLYKNGVDVVLSLYGYGREKEKIEDYIRSNNLESRVILMGNQPQEIIKKAYQESHFVILPSQSEGWPKVVAEGMFWGCLPIATNVSCLNYMLDSGNRGILLKMDTDLDTRQIITLLNDKESYNDKVTKSILWSRKYTLDLFESEIKALLHS